MPKIIRSVKVEVSISPYDMGREFASMCDDEQAMFFQGVASVTKTWPKPSGLQWASMKEKMEGLPDGLAEFKIMSEYGM